MAGGRMELVMDRHQRWIVGALYPAAIVALAVVPWLIAAGDLPDPLANHFAASGRANGSMPIVGQVVFLVVLCGGPALGMAVLARRPTSEHAGQVPVLAFIGLLTGSLWWFTALANRGHGDWHDVHLGLGALVGPLVGSVSATMPVAYLLRRRLHATGRPGTEPALRLASDERVAWFGGAHSYPLGLGGTVFAVVGVVAAVRSPQGPLFGATFVVVGLALAAFASVHVSVGRDGVRVRSGPLGWPRVRFGIDRLESAAAIDARPMALGGWGYRGSVRLGRAAWVVRGGDALELRLDGGRRFVVTVDHAEEAAAVLNGLLARGA